MKRLLFLLAGLWVACSSAMAISFYFSPDVPTDLGGTTYLPWQIVRNDSGIYTLVLSLPSGTHIDSLYRRCDGKWLFSVEAPTDLGGTTYDPRDVILFDGINYSLFFCGGPIGISADANVDAAFMVGGDKGDIVLSFDVPVDLSAIGGAVYEPSDLVRFTRTGAGCIGWTVNGLFFDASAVIPGISISDNVIGAEERAGLTILTVDVPTTLGANTYLPGQLVSWDPVLSAFSTLYADPNWPITSTVEAFCFLPDPGTVPPTIRVRKSLLTPGNLNITWSTSSSAGGEDYGIYEGTIKTWYNHTSIDCHDDGGDLQEEVTPAAGNKYYLVVPNNPDAEGSYGQRSSGVERPQGTSPCRLTQAFGCP